MNEAMVYGDKFIGKRILALELPLADLVIYPYGFS
jgi:hypothetical protein